MIAQEEQRHVRTVPGTPAQKPWDATQIVSSAISCRLVALAAKRAWCHHRADARCHGLGTKPEELGGRPRCCVLTDSIQPILRPHSHNRLVAPMSAPRELGRRGQRWDEDNLVSEADSETVDRQMPQSHPKRQHTGDLSAWVDESGHSSWPWRTVGLHASALTGEIGTAIEQPLEINVEHDLSYCPPCADGIFSSTHYALCMQPLWLVCKQLSALNLWYNIH